MGVYCRLPKGHTGRHDNLGGWLLGHTWDRDVWEMESEIAMKPKPTEDDEEEVGDD